MDTSLERKVFLDIYDNDTWGFGSGHGSLPRVTKPYSLFLQNFIRNNPIQTVVDYGCGDWQFSRIIDWDGIHYVGLDVSDELIVRNRRRYGTTTVRFELSPQKCADLPSGDLLLVKDVLQHLPNSYVF